MRGDRPPRPTHQACSDILWELTQQCWDPEAHLRPEVSEALQEVLQVLPSNILNEIRSLYEPGTASHKFQLALARFYGSDNYQDRVDSLHGTDLKNLSTSWIMYSDHLSFSIRALVLTLVLGATDEGVESKFTPADVAQPTESLRSSGCNSKLPCNLQLPPEVKSQTARSGPTFRGVGSETEPRAGGYQPTRCRCQGGRVREDTESG